MFMAAAAAGPVWRLLGKKDLGTSEFPPMETALVDGDIAYRQHSGRPHFGSQLAHLPRLRGALLQVSGTNYQSHIVPSSRRATGSCFGL